MTGIRFEEPPRARRGGPKFDHRAIVEVLRSKPGEWAVIASFPTAGPAYSMAARIKSGGAVAYSVGEFEAVARKVGGENRVYARFVGGSGGAR